MDNNAMNIKEYVEDAMSMVNWTGLSLRELARAGRIGNAMQTAKDMLPAFDNYWYDEGDIKETILNGNRFVELLIIELKKEIEA